MYDVVVFVMCAMYRGDLLQRKITSLQRKIKTIHCIRGSPLMNFEHKRWSINTFKLRNRERSAKRDELRKWSNTEVKPYAH